MAAADRKSVLVPCLALVFASACATTNQHKGQSANLCPEHSHIRCLTQRVCVLDEDRGCETCYCTDLDTSPGESTIPEETGHPPW